MLTGVTIIDLSLQLPGPYATMLLRHMGARVIKIEPSGGDLARVIDPWMFQVLNAGNECLTIDLRTDGGQEVMARLLQMADMLFEGFRPGVAERLGVGYAQLAERYPGLVYCSISGYGQDGSYRDLPGHDLNYLGVGGGLGGSRPPRELPPEGEPIEIPIVDLAAGSTAALTAIAALRERDRTGRGRYLDVAMLDLAVFWSCIKSGWAISPHPGASVPRAEPSYGTFRASDGRYLTIGVMEDKFWVLLCHLLGWTDWKIDPSMATYRGRKDQTPVVLERLRKEIAARPRDAWLEQMTAAGLPVAPVHSFAEVPLDPQVQSRSLFTRDGDGLRMRPPLPPGCYKESSNPVPSRDAHLDAILDELGYSPAERSTLKFAGAFGRS